MMEGLGIRFLTYGIREKADVFARNIEITPKGVNYDLNVTRAMMPISLRIPGIFSVYNSLSAAAACLLLGEGLEDIKSGLEAMPNVAGRFEVLETGRTARTRSFSTMRTPRTAWRAHSKP